MNKMWILILTIALMGVAFWLLKGVVDRQVAPTIEQALTNATVASRMTKQQVRAVWGEPDDTGELKDPTMSWDRTIWIYHDPYRSVVFEEDQVVDWTPR